MFQEEHVSALEDVTVSVMGNRRMEVAFSGQLDSGSQISMEVRTDG